MDVKNRRNYGVSLYLFNYERNGNHCYSGIIVKKKWLEKNFIARRDHGVGPLFESVAVPGSIGYSCFIRWFEPKHVLA